MIRRARDILAASGQDQRGSMAIETAILAPVLIAMAIGGFEVSTVVARQTELQSAAAEAAAIVRAALPETSQERTTIRDVVATSAGLTSQQVSVTEVYRCGTTDAYVANDENCGTDVAVSTYIRVNMSDTYQPLWTEFGLGGPLDFSVSRTIQVG